MITFKEFLAEAATKEPVLKMRVTKHPMAKRGLYSPTGTFVVHELTWNHGANPDSMFVSYLDENGHTNGWGFDRKDPPKFIKFMLGSQVLSLKEAIAQMKKQGKDGEITVHGGPAMESVGVPNPTPATKKDAKMAAAVVDGYRKHIKTSGFNQTYAKKHKKEMNESYSETGVQSLYRKAFGAAANDKWWSKWNRADAAGKQAIWDHLTKKAEERSSVSENLNGSPVYRQIVKALPIGLADEFKEFAEKLEQNEDLSVEQIDTKMRVWARKNGAKFESLDEGMHVVKNKDGVERRFKPGAGGDLSDEAKAYKETSKAKVERFSKAYWEKKEDADYHAVTPWTRIKSDDLPSSNFDSVLKQHTGGNVADWTLGGTGTKLVDGMTVATAKIRVLLSYSKDDDLGLEADTEDSQNITIRRDTQNPKKFVFVGY